MCVSLCSRTTAYQKTQNFAAAFRPLGVIPVLVFLLLFISLIRHRGYYLFRGMFGAATIRGRRPFLSDIYKPSKIYFAKVLALQKIQCNQKQTNTVLLNEEKSYNCLHMLTILTSLSG